MGSILEAIEDWIRGLLVSGIMGKGDRGFIYSKIMRIWRRKKVDDTVCVIELMVSNIRLFATRC